MFDIGWTELLLVGVVALIVVGPKDLPHLFHSLGRLSARARGMAREFTSAMEDAAKGSGLDEAAGSLRDMKSLTSKKAMGLDALDRAAERFEKWEPKRPDNKTVAKTDPGLESAANAEKQPEEASTPASSSPSSSTGEQAPNPVPARQLHAVRRSDMKDD
ncbi:Sec-independent protein translocase protein TatB [Paracoccus sp. Z330]|uniref:Sec-independent protein translocase protein TatB n=1 Tax=Paracoccus onchidii TaxID=3017813 RepID=A0ABT4ZJC7_9RHOB|nr:Sec-independent protein translocase protein TatB [Paracoccus onchidii]MDB6179469.1 Sec-independent protein translocase protein TatB [Paracoccus onchidii]